MLRLLFLLIMISCTGLKTTNQPANVVMADTTEEKFIYKVSNVEVFNGKVKFIDFPVRLIDGTYILKCTETKSKNPAKNEFPIMVENNNASIYYAESYFSVAKGHECFLNGHHVLSIKVKQFPYKKERVNGVPKAKVKLSKKDQARTAREWHMTQKVYKNSEKRLLFSKPFVKPLNSFITSRYGKRRIFNNMKKSQHLGNDFRAKVGVPIPTSNSGKVVFTGDLFYTGKVVIVDHGMNIFTLYAHLSKIISKTGDMVEQGDIVGLSGKTGRVSGPHLHWGVKMNGYNIDGFSLVDESVNQFK